MESLSLSLAKPRSISSVSLHARWSGIGARIESFASILSRNQGRGFLRGKMR
jgi:hypothetical protein